MKLKTRNMTEGSITLNIIIFAIPLILGNLLQQMYNIADTWVVGRFLGSDSLAAVGSAYALITFLTSVASSFTGVYLSIFLFGCLGCFPKIPFPI